MRRYRITYIIDGVVYNLSVYGQHIIGAVQTFYVYFPLSTEVTAVQLLEKL